MLESVKKIVRDESLYNMVITTLEKKQRSRNDNIFYKALKGDSVSDLANEFGMSKSRVGQIVARSCRQVHRECEESRKADSIYNLYLSTRSYNALMRANIRTIEKLGVALQTYGVVGLMTKLRNVGEQSMKEIVSKYTQYTGNSVVCDFDTNDDTEDLGYRLVIYDKIADNYKSEGIYWGSLDDARKYKSLARAKEALGDAQYRHLGSKDLVLRKCRTVLVED